MKAAPSAAMDLSGSNSIIVELVRNELEALVDETRIAVQKTGRSPMVKVGDFAVTLCDANGRGIGVGPQNMMVPMFFDQAKRVLSRFGDSLAPGDAFIVNDPYSGASHVPDMLVVSPLFWRKQLVAFSVIYSHHTDMGGRFPGSVSGKSMSMYEEGLHVPLTRISSGGELNQAVLDIISANVRSVDDFFGDIDAKLAGNRRAGLRLEEILDKYGVSGLSSCCDYLNQVSEQAMRAALRSVPDGDFAAEGLIFDDGTGALDEPAKVRITLQVRGESLIVDFAGTANQLNGGINIPFGNTFGVVMATMRDLLTPDVTLNDGLMAPIDVIASPGTITNPVPPAATSGRASRIVDETIHLALAKAVPDRVPVPRGAWDVVHFSGIREDGSNFVFMDMFSGGWGGRPGKDGPDGIAPLASVTLPVELIEREFPVVVESFGLVEDTAGAGAFRGSLAVERRYRFLSASDVMVRTNRVRGSEGLAGGWGGAPSLNRFILGGKERQMALQAYTHFSAHAGDRFVHRVGGAGGYGNPWTRDPAFVQRDLDRGLLSPDGAARDYGVVVHSGTGKVDVARTVDLRNGAVE